MKWRVTFFDKKVKTQALAFPKGILANFLHSISLVERFGPHVGMPYTRFRVKRQLDLARQRMKLIMK